LYIESVDIGLNHNNTEFFDYLGLQFLGDGSEQEVVKLKGGPECLASYLTYFYEGGISPHYSLDRLESNGSQLLFSSDDGFGRMFIMETPVYRAVSSSILLGAMATGDSLNLKAYLVSELVNTFLGYNTSTALKETLSSLHSLPGYPNPFTDKTRIEFNLSEAGHVIAEVYDMGGKRVKQLINCELTQGVHSVIWDATNESGCSMQSGYYFCKIYIGDAVTTEKMILLR
jgi:hypothetical protein